MVQTPLEKALDEIKAICNDGASKSHYFPFGGEGYKSCVRHFLESSCEIAAGAVQPGSVDDLKKIMDVLATHEAPFAIKGGGHATNPGFSSTTGVQISMALFNKIEYDENFRVKLDGVTETEEKAFHVGAGCLFDELYREVIPKGVNIVGGSSIGGVGVAGWLLGGGFSLKTNQHGLGIDNILAVDVVLPRRVFKDEDGETKTENARLKTLRVDSGGDDKELFNAIKGGGNNFGVVTKFTLLTHKQKSTIYGGLLTYEEEEAEDVKKAIVSFAGKEDQKASIVAAFRYYNRPDGEDFQLTVQCFYDGKKPEADPFSEFLDIDHEAVGGGGDTVGFIETPSNVYASILGSGNSQNMGSLRYPVQTSGSLEESSFTFYDQKFSLVNSLLDQAPVDVGDIDVGFAYPDMASVGASKYFNSVPYMSSHNLYVSGASGGAAVGSLSTLKSYTKDPFKRGMNGVGEHARGRWGNVMVGKYTKEIVDEIERQAKKAAKHLVKHRGKTVVIDIWPFTTSMVGKKQDAAWPHDTRNGPALVYFLWEGAENDDFWINKMKKVMKAIKKKVGGTDDRPLYLNTTLALSTGDMEAQVQEIYRGNLANLRTLRKKYDPQLVMDRAGGFKIPHAEMTEEEIKEGQKPLEAGDEL